MIKISRRCILGQAAVVPGPAVGCEAADERPGAKPPKH